MLLIHLETVNDSGMQPQSLQQRSSSHVVMTEHLLFPAAEPTHTPKGLVDRKFLQLRLLHTGTEYEATLLKYHSQTLHFKMMPPLFFILIIPEMMHLRVCQVTGMNSLTDPKKLNYLCATD